MNREIKYENLVKTIAYTNFENFIDSLSAIEYNMIAPAHENTMCLVPQEPNFQLPNIFLRSKLNLESEKILNGNTHKANWTKQIDRILMFLDDLETEIKEQGSNKPLKEEEIEELVKWRFGTK